MLLLLYFLGVSSSFESSEIPANITGASKQVPTLVLHLEDTVGAMGQNRV